MLSILSFPSYCFHPILSILLFQSYPFHPIVSILSFPSYCVNPILSSPFFPFYPFPSILSILFIPSFASNPFTFILSNLSFSSQICTLRFCRCNLSYKQEQAQFTVVPFKPLSVSLFFQNKKRFNFENFLQIF